MSVKMRQEVERKIVRAAVNSALEAGYRLTVSLERGYDIDECLLGSTNRTKIMKEAFAGDECHIFFHDADGPLTVGKNLNECGWIYLVFGNNGWDVISDYTTNLDGLLTKALRISNRYS